MGFSNFGKMRDLNLKKRRRSLNENKQTISIRENDSLLKEWD